MGAKIATICLLALLSGCGPRPIPGGTFCDLAKPEYHSQAVIDAMSEPELDHMIAHNRKGERLCGWKAPAAE